MIDRTQLDQLLPDYFADRLSVPERRSVEEFLQTDEALRREVSELGDLYQRLSPPPAQDPDPALDTAFYAMLARHSAPVPAKLRPLRAWTARVAAGLAILLLGIWVGRNWPVPRPAELARNPEKQQWLALLHHESAADRLQAVQENPAGAEADAEVVAALVHTFQTDESVNVRLAAAEALTPYATQPPVRDALLLALRRAEEPALHLVVIQTLVNVRERQALSSLERLARRPNVDAFVRRRAREGIQELTS